MFYSRITLNASGPYTMHRVSIRDDHNQYIEVRYFWDESELREYAAQWTNTLPYYAGPRFVVNYRPYSGTYSVRDMHGYGRNYRYESTEVKEYRTEKYARRLCERLNYVNGMI